MILTVARRTVKKGDLAPDGSTNASGENAQGDEFERLCRSLRILNTRDMDGTVTVVFRSILISSRERPIGSSELAKTTRLNRVTVIHHLQRLERMGVLEHERHKYRLRVSGLSEMVERMQEEMLESLSEAKGMAAELDRHFMQMSAMPSDPLVGEEPPPHTALLDSNKKARSLHRKNK